MDGHAPANQLRLSLPGADRVKPERNLEAAKPPSAKCDPNLRPLVGSSHGTAVYGPVRTVVWEGRSREAPPYPDSFVPTRARVLQSGHPPFSLCFTNPNPARPNQFSMKQFAVLGA